MGFKTFVNNNLVLIVMIPTLIGLHYGWNEVQASKTHAGKMEQPIISATKKYWSYATNKLSATTSNNTAAPPAAVDSNTK